MSSRLKDVAALKRRFLGFAGLFSLVVVTFSWFFLDVHMVLSVFVGLIAGLLDNFVMFMSVEKGSRKLPGKAFTEMKRSMFKRILIVAVVFFAAIQAGLNVLALFIAFLLIHFVNLVFVVLNARG